jgi:lysophospholipase L1-like esterase
MMQLDAETVVISLGSNDYKGINTELQLRKLRKRVDAKKVFWIVPAGVGKKSGVNVTEIQKIVKRIARDYDDMTVIIPELSKDGVHPTTKGYRKIGELTQ